MRSIRKSHRPRSLEGAGHHQFGDPVAVVAEQPGQHLLGVLPQGRAPPGHIGRRTREREVWPLDAGVGWT